MTTAAAPGGEPRPRMSTAQAEPLDQGAIARDVGLLEVLQQPAPAPDQQQQATPAVVVVLVLPEVLGEVTDALCEHRDLDLRRAGVAFGRCVLGHDLLLDGGVECHSYSSRKSLRGAPGHVHPGSVDPRPI